jgi:hypothetical protein
MGRNLKDYWELDGDIRKFKTLEAAKEVCYEDLKMGLGHSCLESCLEGREIYHFKNDELVEILKVHLNENNDLEFTNEIVR